jgi:primosomal protein N' (replication factor Y)
MYRYEVAVLSRLGISAQQSSFTYQSEARCQTGEVVSVPFRAKTYRGVVLNPSPATSTRTLKSLTRLAGQYLVPASSLQLARWMSEYYASPLGIVLGAFVPQLLASKTTSPPALPPVAPLPSAPIALNTSQKVTVTAISQTGGVHILHGVTGSGKTHVYLQLARQALERQQHVLVLLPEIALTAQLVASFERYFGDRVHLQHSSLTDKQRRELWLSAHQLPGGHIWLGTRSSLFLPLEHIGLIVLDEFHDGSFKQTNEPKYHAATVAAQLGRLSGAIVVFGSATPNVRDLYVARQKQIPVHVLSEPVRKRHSKLAIVDLRSAERNDKAIPWFSRPLEEAVHAAINRQEQVLLFLNRRGSATQLRCSQCGWHMACSRCALSIIYHEDERQMRCHACGAHTPIPLACQECGANDILLKGYGTKELEKILSKRFPEQRVLRFDQDSFHGPAAGEMYEQMRTGSAHILVGTQMLAKGFDLPHLSTVGIVDADTMLQLPDFSASERTFQLITQVMGRGGRRGQTRHVVLQTYQPDHPVIQAAAHEDYQRFYDHELEQRRQVGFPPYRYLLKLSTKHPRSHLASARLQKIVAQAHGSITFLGPAPAFQERAGRESIWQLSALAASRQTLLSLIKTLPPQVRTELDPLDLL